MKLTQKTILITGGTSGIGLELVRQLYEAENKLLVLARSENRLDGLRQSYPDIETFPCDLSNRVQLEDVVTRISHDHPDLSVLINNAAIQNEPLFTSESFCHDNIEKEITTNFTAPMWMVSLLLKTLMQQEKAAIINLTSALALFPKTNSAIYSASKAAMHNVSQSLRYQLSRTNVDVYEAVMPLVDTPMTKGRGGDDKMSPRRAAAEIITGVRRGIYEHYIGKAAFIPVLARIAPHFTRTLLKRM